MDTEIFRFDQFLFLFRPNQSAVTGGKRFVFLCSEFWRRKIFILFSVKLYKKYPIALPEFEIFTQ